MPTSPPIPDWRDIADKYLDLAATSQPPVPREVFADVQHLCNVIRRLLEVARDTKRLSKSIPAADWSPELRNAANSAHAALRHLDFVRPPKTD